MSKNAINGLTFVAVVSVLESHATKNCQCQDCDKPEPRDRKSLLSFMLSNRELYFIGLPLLMRDVVFRHHDDEDEEAAAYLQTLDWFLVDSQGANKFSFVKRLSVESVADDDSALKLLERCLPHVEEIRLLGEWDVAALFASLNKRAGSSLSHIRWSIELETLPKSAKLPISVRQFNSYVDEPESLKLVFKLLNERAPGLVEWHLGLPSHAESSLGSVLEEMPESLVRKLTSANLNVGDVPCLARLPGLALKDLHLDIHCGYDTSRQDLAWEVMGRMEKLEKITIFDGSISLPILSSLPKNLKRLMIKDESFDLGEDEFGAAREHLAHVQEVNVALWNRPGESEEKFWKETPKVDFRILR